MGTNWVMPRSRESIRLSSVILIGLAVQVCASGCSAVPAQRRCLDPPLHSLAIPEGTPRELAKASLPDYRIEPPDLLVIDAIQMVPRSPYALKSFDVLGVQLQRSADDLLRESDVVALHVPGAPVTAPIDGQYLIQPNGLLNLGGLFGAVPVAGLTLEKAQQAIETHLKAFLVDPTATLTVAELGSPILGAYPIQVGGTIDFGLPYGTVRVAGHTVEEAEQIIREQLSRYFVNAKVSASLIEIGAQQQIAGEHMVAPDGSVVLGSFGKVHVTGLTVMEAKAAIEQHLARFLETPEVSVNVFSYNSKYYYIITEGAGFGEGVYRIPFTGNETILDAVSQINGLQRVSSSKMWLARASCPNEPDQILPIDWRQITRHGKSTTNYQIYPGDRIFIAEDRLIALDSSLQKMIAPVERVMGFSLLGASVATRFSGNVLAGGGNPRGSF